MNESETEEIVIDKNYVPKVVFSDIINQLDGNNSLLYESSSETDSLFSSSHHQSSSSESFSSDSNLSMFLPFADHDISVEDISIGESFFTQGIPESSNPDAPVEVPNAPSKKTSTAQSLPNIMVTNHRSIFPKFQSLIDELIECEMHVGIHSEIWEDKEKPEHKNKVEEALELHGILYISNPRPKRRGGGAAITLCDPRSLFTLSKLPIHVPPDLEVCWGLVKPRSPGSIKEIVICSFYCPPYSKKKTKLVEHISVTYFMMKSSYPDCAFICGGDKNDLNIKHQSQLPPDSHETLPWQLHP